MDNWPRIPRQQTGSAPARSGGTSLPPTGTVVMASVEEDLGEGVYALRWAGNRITVSSRAVLSTGQTLILKSEMSPEGKPTLVVQGPALPDASALLEGPVVYTRPDRNRGASEKSDAADREGKTNQAGQAGREQARAAGGEMAAGVIRAAPQPMRAAESWIGLVLEPLEDFSAGAARLLAEAEAEKEILNNLVPSERNRRGGETVKAEPDAAQEAEPEAGSPSEGGRARNAPRTADPVSGRPAPPERPASSELLPPAGRSPAANIPRPESPPAPAAEGGRPPASPPLEPPAGRPATPDPSLRPEAPAIDAGKTSAGVSTVSIANAPVNAAVAAALRDAAAASLPPQAPADSQKPVPPESAQSAPPPESSPERGRPQGPPPPTAEPATVPPEAPASPDQQPRGAAAPAPAPAQSSPQAPSSPPTVRPEVFVREALNQLVKATELPLAPSSAGQSLGAGGKMPEAVAEKAAAILLRAAGLTPDTASLEAAKALLDNNVQVDRQTIQALIALAAGAEGADRSAVLKAAARLAAHDIPLAAPLAEGLAEVMGRKPGVNELVGQAARALSETPDLPEAAPLMRAAKEILDLLHVDLDRADAGQAIERYVSTFGREALGKALALVEKSAQAVLENHPLLPKIDRALAAILVEMEKTLSGTEAAAPDLPADQAVPAGTGAAAGRPQPVPSAPGQPPPQTAPPQPVSPQIAPPPVPEGARQGAAPLPSETPVQTVDPERTAPGPIPAEAAASPGRPAPPDRPAPVAPPPVPAGEGVPPAPPPPADGSVRQQHQATGAFSPINAYLRAPRAFPGLEALNLPPMPKVARLAPAGLDTPASPAPPADQNEGEAVAPAAPAAERGRPPAPPLPVFDPVSGKVVMPEPATRPDASPAGSVPTSAAAPAASQVVRDAVGNTVPPPPAPMGGESPAPSAGPTAGEVGTPRPAPPETPVGATLVIAHDQAENALPPPPAGGRPPPPPSSDSAPARPAPPAGPPRQAVPPGAEAPKRPDAPSLAGGELSEAADRALALSDRELRSSVLMKLESIFSVPGLNRPELELLRPGGLLDSLFNPPARPNGGAGQEAAGAEAKAKGEAGSLARDLLSDEPEKREKALRDLPRRDPETLRETASRLSRMESEILRSEPLLGRLADAASSLRDLGRQLLAVKAENLAGQTRDPGVMLAEVPFKLADNAGDGRMQMFYRRTARKHEGWTSRVILDLNTTGMGPVLGDMRFFGQDMVLNMFVDKAETAAFLGESADALAEALIDKGFRLKSRFLVLPPPPAIAAARPDIAPSEPESAPSDALPTRSATGRRGRLDVRG